MESKKFENGHKVLVVEEDLKGVKLSQRDLRLILEKLNQLYAEGKIKTVEEAREVAPVLDVKEFSQRKEERPKPPRHTKKKGQKY